MKSLNFLGKGNRARPRESSVLAGLRVESRLFEEAHARHLAEYFRCLSGPVHFQSYHLRRKALLDEEFKRHGPESGREGATRPVLERGRVQFLAQTWS